jgi:hypothetical protein
LGGKSAGPTTGPGLVELPDAGLGLVELPDAGPHAGLVELERLDLVTGLVLVEVPDLVELPDLVDWPDAEAMAILTTCCGAMRPDARLYILEDVVPSDEEMSVAQRANVAMKDLNMLVLVGGQERTAREYEDLLVRAGFADVRLLGDAPVNVIEARPS